MDAQSDAEVRARIGALLAGGLQTQTEPPIEDDRAFAVVVAALGALPADDLAGKLVLAGFADRPRGPDAARCQECMYYLLHRQWCDLPELALPVEPDWHCRLWRI